MAKPYNNNDADELIDSRIDGIMSNEPLALRALVHRLETPPFEWPADEILAVLQEHKPAILKYIDRKFQVGQISLPINDIKKLMNIDAQWPELKDMVKKYRNPILKKLLSYLKEGDYKTAVDPIDTLTAMNMGWPELAVMQDSIDERRRQIRESYTLDDNEIEQYKADLLSDIYDKQYTSVIDIIFDITHHKNIGNVERITRALEKHKHGVLRALLNMVLHSSSHDTVSYGPFVLDGFKKLGIKWPELDIIKTSIAKPLTTNKSNTELSENRDNTTHRADEYKREIAMGVIKNDMDWVMESLAEFGWTDSQDLGDVTDLNRILVQHKQRIMKGIRDYMLGLDSDGICYIMPQILAGLENAGITWPDLKVLEQSVDLIQQEKEEPDDINEHRKFVNNTTHRNRRA
jgi:hypothetical protein